MPLNLGGNDATNVGGPMQAVDSLNPVEQVQVAAAAVGTWIVKVKGTTVPEGPQKYAVIATGKLTSDGYFGSGKAYIVALVAGVALLTVAAFVKLNWVTISAYCAASGISFNRIGSLFPKKSAEPGADAGYGDPTYGYAPPRPMRQVARCPGN